VIRRHIHAFRLSLMAADAASAAAIFVVASMIRFGPRWQGVWHNLGLEVPLAMAVAALAWTTVMWLSGLYRLRARLTIRTEMLDIVKAGLLIAVLTFAALYVFKIPQVSRLFLLLLFVAQLALTMASRVVLRRLLAGARERGRNTRHMLVVGTGRPAQAFAERIERHRELGLRVIGHLAVTERDGPAGHHGQAEPRPNVTRPILGHVDDIEDVLHTRVVDEVAICLPAASVGLIEPIARLCEEEGKVVRVPLADYAILLPGGRLETFDGLEILSLVYGPDRLVGLLAKRVLDIVVSAGVLVLLSPILALLAGAVAADDGRPVLFRQARVGLHGRVFSVVKFRTMVRDAEARVTELAALNEISGPAFKVTADPRLTRVGRWLRRTSLDELPQFWNVLRGEMSVVGPRPPLPREVAEYDIWHRRRLAMKPGITGLWQVSARLEEDFDRWVELDLDYIDRWSLWLDLKIMVRTVPAMLHGR
jgi:exopolysaccharide biosynthesis polyprenyl glycosylphosphotransferase